MENEKKKSELNESRLVSSCLLKKKKYGGQEKSFPDILKIITSNVHFSQFNERTRSYSLIIRFSKE